MDPLDLARRFNFHPANPERGEQHATARDACHQAAAVIDSLLRDSREKSLAITALEEAMMWANAGIARQGADADAAG